MLLGCWHFWGLSRSVSSWLSPKMMCPTGLCWWGIYALPSVGSLSQFSVPKRISLGWAACHEKELCTVSDPASYMEHRGWGARLLFQHVDGTPMTKHQFWTVTTRALTKLELSGVKFGTHSFQIGTASTASTMGYVTMAIKKLGH